MKSHHITFWNLENLFDKERSEHRSDKLQRAIGGDLDGWTQFVLNKKLKQLASIIEQLNNGLGPDILGVAEVENAHVLQQLIDEIDIGRNYALVHHDSDDQRGIDVAFIYDSDKFTPGLVFDHVVMRRTATRAILQVHFTTEENNLLVLFANHFPSRSGGQFKSEGYRNIAGETLAYFHQRVIDIHGKDTAVLAMGDFNDEPFNDSMMRYALSLRSRQRVVNGNNPYFLNMMWSKMDEGVGTFIFDNQPNMLDQFLCNKNLLIQNRPLMVDADSISIDKFPEMVTSGRYPAPKRFGGMGKPVDESGFSDHYPISIVINERESS